MQTGLKVESAAGAARLRCQRNQAEGRVDGGRGGCRSRESLFPAAFATRRCLSLDPDSVSRRRSSNRTCGSPASGSRTGFTTGRAQTIAYYPAPRERALRSLLGPAIELLPQTLDYRVLALRQCPVLVAFRSAPEPGLQEGVREPGEINADRPRPEAPISLFQRHRPPISRFVALPRDREEGRVGGGRGGCRSRESLLPAAFALMPVPQSRP
jgi:hypothetical protein